MKDSKPGKLMWWAINPPEIYLEDKHKDFEPSEWVVFHEWIQATLHTDAVALCASCLCVSTPCCVSRQQVLLRVESYTTQFNQIANQVLYIPTSYSDGKKCRRKPLRPLKPLRLMTILWIKKSKQTLHTKWQREKQWNTDLDIYSIYKPVYDNSLHFGWVLRQLQWRTTTRKKSKGNKGVKSYIRTEVWC